MDLIHTAEEALGLKQAIMESGARPLWLTSGGLGPMFYTGDLVTVEFEVVTWKSVIIEKSTLVMP